MYQIGHAVGCLAWAPIYSWDILPNTHRSIEIHENVSGHKSVPCYFVPSPSRWMDPLVTADLKQEIAVDLSSDQKKVWMGEMSLPSPADRTGLVPFFMAQGESWQDWGYAQAYIQSGPRPYFHLFPNFFFSSIDCGSPDLRLSAGSGRSALLKSGKS